MDPPRDLVHHYLDFQKAGTAKSLGLTVAFFLVSLSIPIFKMDTTEGHCEILDILGFLPSR